MPPPETSSPALDVLVVEDDPMLRDLLALHLDAQGWGVRTAADGGAALALCAARRPDIVVLDVMLPVMNGFDVCATLRRLYDPSPGVVMLTARAEEADVVLGLEVGADDYVLKPCRPRELIARIRALLRRVARQHHGAAASSRPPPPDTARGAAEPPAAPPPQSAAPPAADEVFERGRLRVWLGARRVTVDGRPVRLTPTEFALLVFLARVPERVYSRMELLERVWDSTHAGYARNVDCHVTRVRRKLEAAGLEAAPIHTAHGAGYYFATPAP